MRFMHFLGGRVFPTIKSMAGNNRSGSGITQILMVITRLLRSAFEGSQDVPIAIEQLQLLVGDRPGFYFRQRAQKPRLGIHSVCTHHHRRRHFTKRQMVSILLVAAAQRVAAARSGDAVCVGVENQVGLALRLRYRRFSQMRQLPVGVFQDCDGLEFVCSSVGL